MPNVSTLKLNNDVEMPALGLGVFQTPAEETRAAVEAAISSGYRHIDTAAAYGNERQVGEAVRSSGLDRSEVFLETKIWISDYGYDKTLHGFDKSARKLGVDQIDLLILHQALPSDFEATLEAYRALETLLGDGKVRAIGVSNFMVEYLTTLLERATVVPTVNQIEVHPYFQQRQVQAFGAERGIVTQAWSPIGGITFTATPNPQPIASQNPGKKLSAVLFPAGTWSLIICRRWSAETICFSSTRPPAASIWAKRWKSRTVETSSPWHTSKGAGPA